MTAGSGIVGHEQALERLFGAIGSGRAGHAWLFHGPRGVGKKGIAARFASALLCLSGGGAKPCGKCRSCAAAAAGEHPDLDVAAPPEGSRAIPIDSVREINRRASLAPSLCSRRVFIIDDAHAMTEEAANSLLKTIEEPPGPSVFVLVSHKPESLLPTIRSRAMEVRFGALPEEACAALLRERFGVEKGLSSCLSRLSMGSPGRALEIGACAAFRNRDAIREEILKAQRRSIFEGAARLMEIAKEDAGDGPLESVRDGLRGVFTIAAAFLRDIDAARASGGAARPLLTGDAGFLDRGLALAGGEWASPALDALVGARDALEANVSPALVAEWWLSKVVRALDSRRTLAEP